ncbi:MAG: hypothetical protein WC761_04215 [Candidatus Paceibacterota bacterium]|jgi:hypothetical protein
MNTSLLISGNLNFHSNDVLISLVVYEHPNGLPARFCAGLLPAVSLYRKFEASGVRVKVRVIDPSPIASFCNGWNNGQSQCLREVKKFLSLHSINYFIDVAEKPTDEAVAILDRLGSCLESTPDDNVKELVVQVRESGRKHGGEQGYQNSLRYMAAHPFSWHDMHHPSLWKYRPNGALRINLMSPAEQRFSIIREYLINHEKDLVIEEKPVDRYTTICRTPCYIPLVGEPTLTDLKTKGVDWCKERYRALSKSGRAYEQACQDFLILRWCMECW